MTMLESEWNIWVMLGGVVSRRRVRLVDGIQARSQQFAKGGSTVDISAIDRTYIFIYMYIIYNYVAWYVNRTICMRI